MKLFELMETINESENLFVYGTSEEWLLASYDGKNSIPSHYNNYEVLRTWKTESGNNAMIAIEPSDAITKRIIEYFENNYEVFNVCIEQLDSYNGYLGDNRYLDMDELSIFLEGKDAIDLLNMAYFGEDEDGSKESSFNPNRNYFKFNGYGNLVSANWKDYSAFLDEYAVEAMSENRYEIDAIDENEELVELFDALEDC